MYDYKKKIFIITNIPTPYRIPLFNELNTRFKNDGLELLVIFGAKNYPRRKWVVDPSDYQFTYKILPTKQIGFSDSEKYSFTYKGLINLIIQEKPFLIITNGFSIATMKIWFISWFTPLKYIIWSGDIYNKQRHTSFLKKLYRKTLINKASGFVAYGLKAKQYLISLGVDRENIHIGINTVDTKYYKNEVSKLREKTKTRSNKKHLLYIGALSPRKNVLKLLNVLRVLLKSRSDLILDIIGDGNDFMRLKKYIQDHKMDEYVKFHGFKQKSELPMFMAQSDCFLFQTDFDIWGLVLNEAMAAGLPCIASIKAGSTYDLIRNGVTGFSVDFSNTEEVIDTINFVLNNREVALKIGVNAKDFISQSASLKNSGDGFVKAVKSI